MNMADEEKLRSPIHSTFKVLVVRHPVRHCHGEELVCPVDQCWLQALQFLVHLINLLNMHLRCNGFTRIQKAVVDQTSRKPPNTDHDLFGGCKFGLGSASELLFGPTTELVVAGCHTKSTFHHTS